MINTSTAQLDGYLVYVGSKKDCFTATRELGQFGCSPSMKYHGKDKYGFDEYRMIVSLAGNEEKLFTAQNKMCA